MVDNPPGAAGRIGIERAEDCACRGSTLLLARADRNRLPPSLCQAHLTTLSPICDRVAFAARTSLALDTASRRAVPGDVTALADKLTASFAAILPQGGARRRHPAGTAFGDATARKGFRVAAHRLSTGGPPAVTDLLAAGIAALMSPEGLLAERHARPAGARGSRRGPVRILPARSRRSLPSRPQRPGGNEEWFASAPGQAPQGRTGARRCKVQAAIAPPEGAPRW